LEFEGRNNMFFSNFQKKELPRVEKEIFVLVIETKIFSSKVHLRIAPIIDNRVIHKSST